MIILDVIMVMVTVMMAR